MEEKQSDLILLKKIQDVVNTLNEVDNALKTNGERLSATDNELNDWLHLIEKDDLTDKEYVNVAKRIKSLRKKRNVIRNEYSILTTFNNNKEKLIDSQTRDNFIDLFQDCQSRMNKEYRNKVLDDKKIKEVIDNGDKQKTELEMAREIQKTNKKSSGRPERYPFELLYDMKINKGMSTNEICQELRCSPSTIYTSFKRHKDDRRKMGMKG